MQSPSVDVHVQALARQCEVCTGEGSWRRGDLRLDCRDSAERLGVFAGDGEGREEKGRGRMVLILATAMRVIHPFR